MPDSEINQLVFEIVTRLRDEGAQAGVQRATAGVAELQKALGTLQRSFATIDTSQLQQTMQGVARAVETAVQPSIDKFQTLFTAVRRDAEQLARQVAALKIPGVDTDEIGRMLSAKREQIALTQTQVRIEREIADAKARQAQIEREMTDLLQRRAVYRAPDSQQFVSASYPGAQRVLPIKLEELAAERAALTQRLAAAEAQRFAFQVATAPPTPPTPYAPYIPSAVIGSMGSTPRPPYIPPAVVGSAWTPTPPVAPPPNPRGDGRGGDGGGADDGEDFSMGGFLRGGRQRDVRRLAIQFLGGFQPQLAGIAWETAYLARFGQEVQKDYGPLAGGLAMGVGGAAIAVGFYMQALEKATAQQVQLNLATKQWDLGALRSALGQAVTELEHFEERAKSVMGTVANVFETGWRKLTGQRMPADLLEATAERMTPILARFEIPLQQATNDIALTGLMREAAERGLARVSTPAQAQTALALSTQAIDASVEAQVRRARLQAEQEITTRNARELAPFEQQLRARDAEITALRERVRGLDEVRDVVREMAGDVIATAPPGSIVSSALAEAESARAGLLARIEAQEQVNAGLREQVEIQVSLLRIQGELAKDTQRRELEIQLVQMRLAQMERELSLARALDETEKARRGAAPAAGRTVGSFLSERLVIERREIPRLLREAEGLEAAGADYERLAGMTTGEREQIAREAARTLPGLRRRLEEMSGLDDEARAWKRGVSADDEETVRRQVATFELQRDVGQMSLRDLGERAKASFAQAAERRETARRRGIEIPKAEALGLYEDQLRLTQARHSLLTEMLALEERVTTAGLSGLELAEQQVTNLTTHLTAQRSILDDTMRLLAEAQRLPGAEGVERTAGQIQSAAKAIFEIFANTDALRQKTVERELEYLGALQREVEMTDRLRQLRQEFAGRVDLPAVPVLRSGRLDESSVMALIGAVTNATLDRGEFVEAPGLTVEGLLRQRYEAQRGATGMAVGRLQAYQAAFGRVQQIAQQPGAGEDDRAAFDRLLAFAEQQAIVEDQFGAGNGAPYRAVVDFMRERPKSRANIEGAVQVLSQGVAGALGDVAAAEAATRARRQAWQQYPVSRFEVGQQRAREQLDIEGLQIGLQARRGLLSASAEERAQLGLQERAGVGLIGVAIAEKRRQLAVEEELPGAGATERVEKLRDELDALTAAADRARFALFDAWEQHLQKTDPFQGLIAGLKSVGDEFDQWGTKVSSLVRDVGQTMSSAMSETFFAWFEGKLKDQSAWSQLVQGWGHALLRSMVNSVSDTIVQGAFKTVASNLAAAFNGGGASGGWGRSLAGLLGGGGVTGAAGGVALLMPDLASAAGLPVGAATLQTSARTVESLRMAGYQIITSPDGAVHATAPAGSGLGIPSIPLGSLSQQPSWLQQFMNTPIADLFGAGRASPANIALAHGGDFGAPLFGLGAQGAAGMDAMFASTSAGSAAAAEAGMMSTEAAIATTGAAQGVPTAMGGMTVGQGLGVAGGVIGLGFTVWGALQGPPTTENIAMSGISGAMSGMMIGAAFGPVGMVVGAIGGALLGGGAASMGKGRTKPKVPAWQRSLEAARQGASRLSSAIANATTPEELVSALNYTGYAPHREVVIIAGENSRYYPLEGRLFTKEALADPKVVETIEVYVGQTGAPQLDEGMTNGLKQKIAALFEREQGTPFGYVDTFDLGGGAQYRRVTQLPVSRLAEPQVQDRDLLVSRAILKDDLGYTDEQIATLYERMRSVAHARDLIEIDRLDFLDP